MKASTWIRKTLATQLQVRRRWLNLQFVFFIYRILIASELIKHHCKMKLPTKRVNKILVSGKINSLYSILAGFYLEDYFKVEGVVLKI